MDTAHTHLSQSTADLLAALDIDNAGTVGPRSEFEIDESEKGHRDTRVEETRDHSRDSLAVFAPKPTDFGIRTQMSLFLVAGAILATAHHLFYAFLDSKPIEAISSPLSSGLQNQSIVNALGNAFAYIAKSFFAAAISLVAIQQY